MKKFISSLILIVVVLVSLKAFAEIRIHSLCADFDNNTMTAQIYKYTVNSDGNIVDTGISAPLSITGQDYESIVREAAVHNGFNLEVMTNLIVNTMTNE